MHKTWARSAIQSSISFSVFLSGCSPDLDRLLPRLMTTPPTGINGVPAADLLGLPPQTHLCILAPYGDEVDEKYPFSKEINEVLKKQNFQASEGIWTIVYKKNEAWILELISRRNLELKRNKGENPQYEIEICGAVEKLRVVKSSASEVSFVKEEK